jgi:hypothetical protein
LRGNSLAKEIEMKRPHLIRIGALGLAAIAILLANVLIASANPLTFNFAVNNSGLVNRIGQVTVGGTMSCDVPGSNASIYGQVTQLSGRAQLSGSFYVNGTCGPTPTKWSATLRADNGIFTGGPAKVTIYYAYACGFNGYFYECSYASGLPSTTSIRLKGGH